ncbi:adenosine tRNA methylthiotransferase [Pseudomonas savastanoi pv. glycinea]|nr:adenosine tRNA methylthiotransferase [Pseudomonas savastanoi pv. glycinea]
MAKKLYIETHGCQMNEYDSSRMVDLLGEHQALEVTARAEDADVILLNTCSIRERAQDRVYSQLGRWRELKLANPEMVIAVGGCVASQEGAAIRDRAPYVDVVFGPQTLHRLPEMIDVARITRLPQVDVSFPEIEKFDHLPEPRVDGPSAYVSVMEGCSKYCTFCVVPYTRGEEVSRPFDDVLSEVIHLAENGVREVTLLGQNVNGYRGTTHDGRVADLADLIRVVRGRWHRPHSLHHLAPAGVFRQPDSGPCGGAGAGQTPALAGAVGFRPHSGGHEAQPHHAGIQVPLAQAQGGRAGHQYQFRLHRWLPRRDRKRFRQHHEAD